MQDNLNQAEAAAYLRITRRALYQHQHRGHIPYTRPNRGKVYFLKKDLDAYLAQGRHSANFELANQADALLLEKRG